MIEERITLDRLTTDSVSIVKQRYYVDRGNTYPIGEEFRVSLTNTEEGRKDLLLFLEEPYLATVLSLWDSKPMKVV